MKSDESAIDPVCGMTIAIDGALTRELEARTYHFCSKRCVRKFDRDAVAYVAASRLNLEGWGRTPTPGFLYQERKEP
jgi:YHS domain-containing protein